MADPKSKRQEIKDELDKRFNSLSDEKVALPKDDDGNVNPGSVGWYAVSDGEGGITWDDSAPGSGGGSGEDGGYYAPSVDDNGNLTWTASKSDMPAVDGANIKGPTGDTGATGEAGPAGADGKDGADGADGADGKSAYAYAVEGGYTGTEAEFAAKLAAEKFANPEALTFTGAVEGSYDGSAPLTVEIPSGGGDADYEFSEKILASGTCVAGSSEPVDTGVTLKDLRMYRMFMTSVAGASNVSLENWYTKIGSLSIGRVNNVRAQSILWEFLNADKTLIMARIGTVGNHAVYTSFKGRTNGYGVTNIASMPAGVVDLSDIGESTPIITYPIGASIDVNWCILGVLK